LKFESPEDHNKNRSKSRKTIRKDAALRATSFLIVFSLIVLSVFSDSFFLIVFSVFSDCLSVFISVFMMIFSTFKIQTSRQRKGTRSIWTIPQMESDHPESLKKNLCERIFLSYISREAKKILKIISTSRRLVHKRKR